MGFVFCTVSWAIDSTIVKNNKKSLFAPVYIFMKRKSKEKHHQKFLYIVDSNVTSLYSDHKCDIVFKLNPSKVHVLCNTPSSKPCCKPCHKPC